MREIFTEVMNWRAAGKPIAVATNVKCTGSSLRPLGAKMAVTPSLEIAGSVTGGCIEGAVYQEAQAVIASGQPKLLHYGVVNGENPWEVGLSCGGTLDVLVESFDSDGWRQIFEPLAACLKENRPVAIATVISGRGLGQKLLLKADGSRAGELGDAGLTDQVTTWLSSQLTSLECAWKVFDLAGESAEVFADVLAPLARLIIVGAVHIAIPLVSLAGVLGYHTIVIDPREAFATRERFPHADKLIVDWPASALQKLNLDEGCLIAMISHDEKLDNPALAAALTSPARYVGVLGARKNLPKRLAALRELGVPDANLGRLHAPIGMNIGAVSPDEIALSILAQMVAARHGAPQG